ncbi:hypothetical protein MtrunA17_Chr7g0245441 [Medicago truncatula]|uniref:Uncharacterized protein n=1 Tax=Medicago truncatula TaxID=3880 RepID=A0A396H050_MEDTR|nr:hypothetical protein MtrunA17_Chr7g0245441 [Medicago truncatula]
MVALIDSTLFKEEKFHHNLRGIGNTSESRKAMSLLHSVLLNIEMMSPLTSCS